MFDNDEELRGYLPKHFPILEGKPEAGQWYGSRFPEQLVQMACLTGDFCGKEQSRALSFISPVEVYR